MNQRMLLHPALRRLLLAAACAAFGAAADAEVAGIVKRAEGTVTVARGGNQLPATVGMPVYQADRVTTGPDGAIGITFEDNSLLSLGPSATLGIDRFAFNSTTHDGSFEVTVARGKLAVVSGKIAKHQEDAMKVRTPSSILGVRGTEFVVEVGDGS